MSTLVKKINSTHVHPNTLAIFWLGQAGFVMKTSLERLIGIDPYLSDCCHRLLREYGDGFKRLMPPPIDDRSLVFDYLAISHDHPDHLDIDSIYNLCDNDRTQIFSNQTCKKICMEKGIDERKFKVMGPESQVSTDEFELITIFSDHGELCKDALGFIFNFGFVKLYFSGDTSLSPDKLSLAITMKPEIAILPINGEFGNLNSIEAAKLANLLNSHYLIPCHFWTFPNHRGDPSQLITAMPEYAPVCKLIMLAQGELFLYESGD